MATVTRSNPKAFETLNAKLKELEGTVVKVGWFESAKYENGTPVALAAAVNELGAPSRSIPARPFIRPTIISQLSTWISLAERGAKSVVEGNSSVKEVMGILGVKIQEDIKEAIANVYSPPLSKVTLLARKRREDGRKVTRKTIGRLARKVNENDYTESELSTNTKPLIETKTMIRTLTNIVEDA